MFLKRKPKPPLERAVALVGEAVEIAYTYKRDKRCKPSEETLRMLYELQEAVFGMHATLGYISRCLEQRAQGEPEGSKKWHDKEVFDYHYPP